jgi:hypothetical protein
MPAAMPVSVAATNGVSHRCLEFVLAKPQLSLLVYH